MFFRRLLFFSGKIGGTCFLHAIMRLECCNTFGRVDYNSLLQSEQLLGRIRGSCQEMTDISDGDIITKGLCFAKKYVPLPSESILA